jgi:Diacylglycerol kinase
MAERDDKLKTAVIAHTKPAGLRRLILASVNSLKGLRSAFVSEAAFRQEVALAVVLVPVGLWLGRAASRKCSSSDPCSSCSSWSS